MGASGSSIEGEARPLYFACTTGAERQFALSGDTDSHAVHDASIALTALHGGLSNVRRRHSGPLAFRRIAMPLLKDCFARGSARWNPAEMDPGFRRNDGSQHPPCGCCLPLGAYTGDSRALSPLSLISYRRHSPRGDWLPLPFDRGFREGTHLAAAWTLSHWPLSCLRLSLCSALLTPIPPP